MSVDVYSAFEIGAMTILGNESRRFVDLPEYQRLEAELAKEREKVQRLQFALADTEALELGTAERLAAEMERAETRKLALDAAVSSSCVLAADLAAAQAVIEQMWEALTEVVDADECQDADGWLCFELSAEAYHRADAALSIQCNQDALHEARALERWSVSGWRMLKV